MMGGEIVKVSKDDVIDIKLFYLNIKIRRYKINL